MVDDYGLLEIRDETKWVGESVSTGCLSEHVMNASDAAIERHTAWKIEVGSMWY